MTPYSDQPHPTLVEAEAHMARGRLTIAIALLSGLVRAEPGNARAWSLLGTCYTESGHQDQAIAALMRALLLDEETATTYEALGCAWLRQNELEEARRWLHAALGADPTQRERASILRNLAMALLKERRHTAAQFLLEESLEHDHTDSLTRHALSWYSHEAQQSR